MVEKEYPQNRQWKQKTYAMPKLPRGEKGQKDSLYKILSAVKQGESPNKILEFEGSTSKSDLNRLCEWLRPVGLVNKENGTWKLTNEAEKIFSQHDNMYLTALFCATIIFMGEILFYLQEPKKMSELLDIAVNDYHINWKTKSELGNRISWFREVGLIEYEDYKLQYSLTERGRDFLKNIVIVKPQELVTEIDKTINEEQVPIAEWAVEQCHITDNDTMRKMSIGYVPGKTSDVVSTIQGYLQLIGQVASVEEIRQYSASLYKIAVSSSNMFTTFLERINFIERISKTDYCLSELGREWMEEPTEINLLACIHRNYLFVFEILTELRKGSKDAKTLSTIAKVSYGFHRESIDEIRKRIILLKAAQMIMDDGPEKYCLTKRGSNLLNIISMDEAIDTQVDLVDHSLSKADDEPKAANVENIITELRIASKDSSNPDRFEQAIKAAFEYMGFKSTWLGGSGKTDVLLQAQTSPKFTYTVAVDAKSTASGSVPDGQISFDTLEEHRKMHQTNYMAVVGCKFENERLIKRAQKHQVVLVDVDDMEYMIRTHYKTPLASEDYRAVFSQSGKVDVSVLDSAISKISRYGLLVDAIMSCLVKESTDEVTEGILTVKEIYRSVRDDVRFSEKPELTELENVIGLLSSPLICCIGTTKEGYYAIGSLAEASNKFNFYAKACKNRLQLTSI